MYDIIVLGAGESGFGAALLAKTKGYRVLVSDNGIISPEYKSKLNQEEIDFEENGHSIDKMKKSKYVVKSPGIPNHIPLIKNLKKEGLTIISEIEWAAKHCEGQIVAITGSNGKTTTATLTYEVLKANGFEVELCGNIGNSFSQEIALRTKKYYVLEVSSFQLDDILDFKPKASMVLNITPDHLDRYDYQMENYVHSKFKIKENQDQNDVFIYNNEDPVSIEYLKNHKVKATKYSFSNKDENQSAYLSKDFLNFNISSLNFNIPLDEINLVGNHNYTNCLAAILGAAAVLDEKDSLDKQKTSTALKQIKPLEHRLEKLEKESEIEFINDSKATNVNSTFYALNAMRKPTVWIVGGVDKGNDYSEIQELVKQKVKAIICLGIDNEAIINFFQKDIDSIQQANNMQQALSLAKQESQKGDVVLLSPACASFDLFDNYQDRGNQFKQCVKNL